VPVGWCVTQCAPWASCLLERQHMGLSWPMQHFDCQTAQLVLGVMLQGQLRWVEALHMHLSTSNIGAVYHTARLLELGTVSVTNGVSSYDRMVMVCLCLSACMPRTDSGGCCPWKYNHVSTLRSRGQHNECISRTSGPELLSVLSIICPGAMQPACDNWDVQSVLGCMSMCQKQDRGCQPAGANHACAANIKSLRLRPS